MLMEMHVASTAAVRRQNAFQVLLSLWSGEPLTRAQLSQRVGITRPAITRITQELLRAGHVHQEPSASPATGPGRPLSVLSLRPRSHLCVGLDLRLDRGLVRAADLQGTVLSQDSHFPSSFLPQNLVSDLAGLLRDLQAKVGLPISGVGISMPVRVSENGRRATGDHFGWVDEPIADLLADELGLPARAVQLVDVSAGAALANWREVAASAGKETLAHLQMGLGAGLGVAGRGPMLPVVHSLPVGHLPMHVDGPRCRCGRHGCLDAVAGFEAFTRLAGVEEELAPSPTGVDMQRICAAVVERARCGDQTATEAVATMADWLARASATVLSLRQPSYLTLGGYPSYLGATFRDVFEKRLASLAPDEGHVLMDTRWGDDASAQGAVLLATQAALEQAAALRTAGER